MLTLWEHLCQVMSASPAPSGAGGPRASRRQDAAATSTSSPPPTPRREAFPKASPPAAGLGGDSDSLAPDFGNSSVASMGKTVHMIVLEDHDAVIKIVLKGITMALRHVLRTHRVALDWLYERFQDQPMRLQYINTKFQLADMFTKHFRTADPWRPLCYMLG